MSEARSITLDRKGAFGTDGARGAHVPACRTMRTFHPREMTPQCSHVTTVSDQRAKMPAGCESPGPIPGWRLQARWFEAMCTVVRERHMAGLYFWDIDFNRNVWQPGPQSDPPLSFIGRRAPSRRGVALPIRRAVGSKAGRRQGKAPKAPGFWTSSGKSADFDLRSAGIPKSDVSSYPVGQTVQGGDAPWHES